MSDRTRELRSHRWFQPVSLWGAFYRAWTGAQGFGHEAFDGRPVVGIANSWSELNNCNANLRDLAEAVKRGVWRAGGFPVEFPTISLGETLIKPTAMLYRNLMAMDVEEMITCHPLDAVVLLSGCDKTTPAQWMGAISADVPAVMLTGGPMLQSCLRGRDLGAGHVMTEYLNDYHAGNITRDDLTEIETCIARSVGHCNVMGTASTMAALVEAMGLMLPGGATLAAPDARRAHLAERTGELAVDMALNQRAPSKVISPRSIENAIRILHALGGSTNAVIHLIAIARRLGYRLTVDTFDALGRTTPRLANVAPSGPHGMEALHDAGGVAAVMHELRDLLHLDAQTADGRTIGQWLENTQPSWNRDVIRERKPGDTSGGGGIVSLRGSLAPDGALIKTSAASESLMRHRGPALVFDHYDDLLERFKDPALDVTPDHVIVLRNGGPIGNPTPGMPEWAIAGLPVKLHKQGVRDMVRITDARASGTSYGTLVVHAAPEAARGGPIALVRDGDMVELDVTTQALNVDLDDDELQRRRAAWQPPAAPRRGYRKLFIDAVLGADEGVDFDFLTDPDTLKPFEVTA